MVAQSKMFKSSIKSWETLFEEASNFATEIGESRTINISHSQHQNTSVVVVWYWDKPKKTQYQII